MGKRTNKLRPNLAKRRSATSSLPTRYSALPIAATSYARVVSWAAGTTPCRYPQNQSISGSRNDQKPYKHKGTGLAARAVHVRRIFGACQDFSGRVVRSHALKPTRDGSAARSQDLPFGEAERGQARV